MGKKNRKISSQHLIENTERLFCEILHLSIPPPPEICVIIFSFLPREDLLSVCQINRAWYNFTRNSREYNEIWWRICNNEWYQDSLEKPKTMTHKDRQKSWKQAFITLTPRIPITVKKKRDESRRKLKEWEIDDDESENNNEQEEPGAYKKKMRDLYKGVRSKPFAKEVGFNPLKQDEWSLLCSYD